MRVLSASRSGFALEVVRVEVLVVPRDQNGGMFSAAEFSGDIDEGASVVLVTAWDVSQRVKNIQDALAWRTFVVVREELRDRSRGHLVEHLAHERIFPMEML